MGLLWLLVVWQIFSSLLESWPVSLLTSCSSWLGSEVARGETVTDRPAFPGASHRLCTARAFQRSHSPGPQHILPTDGPGDGWSESGLCSWPTTAGAPCVSGPDPSQAFLHLHHHSHLPHLLQALHLLHHLPLGLLILGFQFGEVGGWMPGRYAVALLGRGQCQTHREHRQRWARRKDWHQTAHQLDCQWGGDVLGWVQGCGFSGRLWLCSVCGGHMEMQACA